MNELTLRSGDEQPPMPLAPGAYGLTAGADGDLRVVDDPDATAVLTIDRRGCWLQVNDSAAAAHVNGRPVRRIAWLRAGDVLHIGNAEGRLEGRIPDSVDPDAGTGRDSDADVRVILRAVGGLHHGRSFSLSRPCVVGCGSEAQIRIDGDSAHVGHRARVERLDDGVLLRDLGAPDATWVNGHPVRNALLRSGDQLVFDARHRFVLEMPGAQRIPEPVIAVPVVQDSFDETPARAGSKLPWVLLAAIMLAALLALLLWGGGIAPAAG